MDKEQHLTFNLGISNVPGDVTCDDNALSECIGMVYEDGEHRPVQEPKKVLEGVDGKLLYIHKHDNAERYIIRKSDGIYWCLLSPQDDAPDQLTEGTKLFEETDGNTVLQVSSIGKTLIVTTAGAVEYYIWKADRYKLLDSLPEPEVEFVLSDLKPNAGYQEGTVTYMEFGNIFDGLEFHAPHDESQKAWNDLVIGLYARNKTTAHKAGRFVNPFFIRVALEMYDSTYSKISNPILMVPTLRWNSEISLKYGGDGEATLRTYSCSLLYRLKTNYTDYKDLIKGVTVFVSNEVETQITTADIPKLSAFTDGKYDGQLISISETDNNKVSIRHEADTDVAYVDIVGAVDRHVCKYQSYKSSLSDYHYDYYPVPLPRSEEDIVKDLKDVRVYYKLADIGRQPSNYWTNIKDHIDDGVLENITTQTKLMSDNASDYFDHAKLSGGFAYVYNSRLNLTDVRRTFFDGFSYFMPYDNRNNDIVPDSPATYRAYVTIRTDNNEETIISKQYDTVQKQGLWFYYPDARATHVKIFKRYSGNYRCILDADLTEHKGLNGAYYFKGLPFGADYDEEQSIIAGVAEPTVTANGTAEELTNYIVVSEVNNPFVFKAEGYVQVGVGRVKAMSTITQAISQGQFGGFPLIAFSDNGVWALSVANTGIINNAAPKEREVISSPLSVTQSDDAVFFVSKRGLMAVVGDGNGVTVKCISDQLKGKNYLPAQGENIPSPGNMDFITFLQNAQIAYDYRDSLLWIGREDSDIFWLYSIKNGTFHRYTMSEEAIAARHRASAAAPIFNFVNNYPDYLLQINGDVYSFMERPNINDDEAKYAGKIVTRPMKFGNGLALKSIMQMKQVKELNAAGKLAVAVEGSNDLTSWRPLSHLRGTPWKYFRMTLDFTDLAATDRYSGMVLITQERRTNKLR